MTFRYYIADMANGMVEGTNDEKVARKFQGSEDFFVIDSEKGHWLTMEGDEEITEVSDV